MSPAHQVKAAVPTHAGSPECPQPMRGLKQLLVREAEMRREGGGGRVSLVTRAQEVAEDLKPSSVVQREDGAGETGGRGSQGTSTAVTDLSEHRNHHPKVQRWGPT